MARRLDVAPETLAARLHAAHAALGEQLLEVAEIGRWGLVNNDDVYVAIGASSRPAGRSRARLRRAPLAGRRRRERTRPKRGRNRRPCGPGHAPSRPPGE